MENKFRNEKEIQLGEKTILLRPTFANLSTVESTIGPVASIAVKISEAKKASEAQIPLVNLCTIIHLCQADKKMTIEEVFDLCVEEGYPSVKRQVMEFLIIITAGKKQLATLEQPEKKT